MLLTQPTDIELFQHLAIIIFSRPTISGTIRFQATTVWRSSVFYVRFFVGYSLPSKGFSKIHPNLFVVQITITTFRKVQTFLHSIKFQVHCLVY